MRWRFVFFDLELEVLVLVVFPKFNQSGHGTLIDMIFLPSSVQEKLLASSFTSRGESANLAIFEPEFGPFVLAPHEKNFFNPAWDCDFLWQFQIAEEVNH